MAEPRGSTVDNDPESQETSEPAKKQAKRLPQGSLKLQFAGELVLVRNPTRDLAGLFRRYEALFEAFLNAAVMMLVMLVHRRFDSR